MVVKIFLSLLHFFHTISLLALVPEGAYSLALSKSNYDSPLGLRYSDGSGQSYIHLPNWGGGGSNVGPAARECEWTAQHL